MKQQARRAGYGFLVATSDYQADREAAIVEHMLRQRVAGLVLTVADADSSAHLLALGHRYIVIVAGPCCMTGRVSVISATARRCSRPD